MANFYSGNGLGRKYDTILSNYINGVYFSTSKHMKEKLGTKLNKYNKEFIIKYNELNIKFYGLIAAYSCTIQLLDDHKNEIPGILKNLYGLMSAQSGTIKYNKVLKKALSTYGITQKALYDALNEHVKNEEDRIRRNMSLLTETMDETGLTWVSKVIELEEHRSIFESTFEFVNAMKENNKNTDEEQEKEFYKEVRQQYVEYLKRLAKKYGINSEEVVQDALLEYLESRRDLARQINSEVKAKKAEERKNKAINSIASDNTCIQREMLELADIIESRLQGKYFGTIQASQMSNYIYENKVKQFWYIAVCKQTKVGYIIVQDKTILTTQSLIKTTKFRSMEDAQKYLDIARGMTDLSGYYMCVQVIKTGYVEASKLISNAKNTIIETDDTLRHVITDIGQGFADKKATTQRYIKEVIKATLHVRNNEIVADDCVAVFVLEKNGKYNVLECVNDNEYRLGEVGAHYTYFDKYDPNIVEKSFLINKTPVKFRQVKIDIAEYNMSDYARKINESRWRIIKSIDTVLSDTNYLLNPIELLNYAGVTNSDIEKFCIRMRSHHCREVYFVTVFDKNDRLEKFLHVHRDMITVSLGFALRFATIFDDIYSMRRALDKVGEKNKNALCTINMVLIN